MIYEFLAIIAVTILLLVFAVLFLQSLSANADIRVRRDMKRLLTSYDHIIEEKSQQISDLNRKIADLEDRNEILTRETASLQAEKSSGSHTAGSGRMVLPGQADYRMTGLMAGYEAMKQGFGMTGDDRSKIIARIFRESGARENQSEDYRRLKKLREALSFESVCSLSRLTAGDQYDLLAGSLSAADQEILAGYMEGRKISKFDASAFSCWLDEQLQLADRSLEIRCGDKEVCKEEGFLYEEQICEGIQIRVGDRIYDYSVKESEIS